MARSWNLEDTRTGAVDDTIGNYNTFGTAALYFSIVDSGGDGLVIQWDPGGFSDISGSTFNGLEIYGLTVFNGTLYALAVKSDLTEAYVYRHNSGASWSLMVTIAGLSGAGNYYLDSDSNRIVVALNDGVGGYVYASGDGTSWAAQTAAGGSFGTFTAGGLIGQAQRTHSSVIIFDGDCWAHSSGNNWARLNGGAVMAGRLAGYAWGYSWFHDGSNTLNYSDDWGETYDSASGTLTTSGRVFVQTLSGDTEAYLLGDDNTYVYDHFTITWSNDGTPNGGHNIKLLAGVGGLIYALVQNGDDAEIWLGGALTPIPGTDLRLLGLAADQGNLYVTRDEDNVLQLWTYDLATLAFIRESTFGAATYAELDARTYGLMPEVKPGAEGVVYLRGRDGSDIKIQVSDESQLIWTSLDDGGWAANKFAVAMHPDPLNPADLVAVFSDQDIWRSQDGGTAWVKMEETNVTPSEVSRHPIWETDLLIAGAGAGANELEFTPNYGLSLEDVSEATMGIVNAIEVSR